MTRHETIIAGRSKRPVRVERRTSRWSRRDIHAMGLAIVAHELGFADEELGGVMTGERMRELLKPRPAEKAEVVRKGASNGGEKRDIGQLPGISRQFVPSPLAADISRNIYPDRQRQFGADLIGGVL